MLEKKEKICYIVDDACPFDPRIERKKKVKHYTDYKYEVLEMWKNGVSKENIGKYLEIIGFDGLEKPQKAFLFGTARILIKVLDCND